MKTSLLSTVLCAMVLVAACDSSESSIGKAGLNDNFIDSEQTENLGLELAASLPNEESDGPDHVDVSGLEVLAAEHSSLLALSTEEAAWLERHGYPTPEEMEALRSYDVASLEDGLRERKDVKAAALLGHRLMLDGDMDGALSAFSVGAALGSLYARQQMAIVGAQRTASMSLNDQAASDPAVLGVMIAHLEVARMLGDHRAQSLIDQHSADFNWKYYGRNVLKQTAIFMDQYGLHARSTGRRAVGPDPRPNAFEWQQLEKDPGARVTLYTRSRANP